MTAPSAVPRPDSFVDTHVHFWDPGRFRYRWLDAAPALRRPFLPADLLREIGSADHGPPTGVVAVEADRTTQQARDEAEWVVGLSSPALPVVGVVAHADVEQGVGCALRIDRLAALHRVVGVRRLVQDERPGFSTRPGFASGVSLVGERGLPFDLCVRSHQLPEVSELVRRLPGVLFVLDHVGKPEITPAAFTGWARDLSRLAVLPNVRCKLSGLATEADPDHRTAAALTPFLRHAIDVFGPSRTMFASDWPVLTQAMSYTGWLDVVREAVDDLDAGERDLVLRGTALTTYRTAERAVTTDGEDS